MSIFTFLFGEKEEEKELNINELEVISEEVKTNKIKWLGCHASKTVEFIEGESQEKTILRHLIKYGSITSREAWEKYNISRLSAYIFTLRDSGNKIETTREVSYAKYTYKA